MGKLMDKVMGQNEAYEEELRKESEVAKSKPSNKKGGQPKQITRDNDQERCWESIERLSKSFCNILETPNLVNKLDEHTFRELVSSQLILFNCVNEKYWSNEGGDE